MVFCQIESRGYAKFRRNSGTVRTTAFREVSYYRPVLKEMIHYYLFEHGLEL